MKKAMSTMWIIIEIIIIFIVVFTVLSFFPGKTFAIVNNITSWFGDEDSTEKISTSSAQMNFNTFIKNLAECKTLKGENCFCRSDLILPEGYSVKVGINKLTLLKGNNVILENDLSTFLLKKDFKYESKEFIIKFDKDVKIANKLWFDTKLYVDKPFIYKLSDKLCWVSKEVNEEKLKNINNCK